jgi:lipopolysaccharide heptosyltransferase II
MVRLPALRPARTDLKALRPRRVCLIKPSALGDVVNAFPALAALRSRWPGAHLTWVVNRGLRGLLDGHPEIDAVIAYDRSKGEGRGSRLGTFTGLLRALRGERFDLTIDLQGLLRSGVMTAATGAPVRVGLADAREGARWVYTHRVEPPGTRESAHAVDRLLAVAAAFGADVSNPTGRVAIADEDRRWARAALEGVARPRLGLNLGARWETKRWPPSHFAEVARQAVASRGAGLFAVGAPEDQPFVDELIARLAPVPVIDLCGRTTLPQLAALGELTDVLLSNDTGPLHLMGTAGARVVGVYTCTKPEANGPYGPRAVAVQSTVACAGSYHVHCPRRLECMIELTPARVWPAVLAQLDEALAERPRVTAA